MVGNSKLSFIKKYLPIVNLNYTAGTQGDNYCVIQCPPGANPNSKFPMTLNGTLYSCQLLSYKNKIII